MNATTANDTIRIHLLVLAFSIHFLAFMPLHYYEVKHVISNFRGRKAYRLHRQGFRGKYRSRNGEDDFLRNLKGQTLQVVQGGALPLPVNWNDRAICLSRF